MVVKQATTNIWIGNWHDARDFMMKTELPYYIAKRMKTITCAFDSPYHGDYYYAIVDGPGDDKVGISKDDNYKAFIAAVEKLKELQSGVIPTLVHCMEGRSRSVAVVVRYLMQYGGIDYNTAVKLLTDQGVDVKMKTYFVEILNQ